MPFFAFSEDERPAEFEYITTRISEFRLVDRLHVLYRLVKYGLATTRPRPRSTLLFMLGKKAVKAALLLVIVGLESSALGFSARPESFDKPLRETVVDLGPSPYLMPRSSSRIQLFCSYYPTFMVKQLNDPGLKGTRWVTIAPVLKEQIPDCRRSQGPAERFVAKDWWSFIGIKGSFLFLEAADSDHSGIPFRILDLKTGKKIFEDSEWWDRHLEFVPYSDGRMSLRYQRAVEGDCSIPKSGASCWNKFKQKFGLPLATAPNCTGYEGEQPTPAEQEQTESAIGYPVEVQLLPHPSMKAVPGPVKCRPVE